MRQLLTDRADRLADRRRFWILLLGVVLPGAAALLWSQSRTSAVAAGFGLIVAVLPLERARWDWAPPAIAAAAGLMITVPVIISETIGYTFNGRGIPWALAQDEFERNPLVGRGPEFCPTLIWRCSGCPGSRRPHNMMMQATGESGLVGLVTLAALIFVMALIAVRAVRLDRQWALMIFVTFCLLGGQESTLSLPVRSALVVQLAIFGSSAVLIAREDERKREELARAKAGCCRGRSRDPGGRLTRRRLGAACVS